MGDFWTETTRTARKPHQCGESFCRRTREIKPGDQYVRIAGSWEGMFFTFKSCLRCARLRKKAVRRYPPPHPDEGPLLGELLEYFRGWR